MLASQFRSPAKRNAATIQPRIAGIAVPDPLVDGELREEGRRERRRGRREERHDRERRAPPVGLREADEDADAAGGPRPAPVVDLGAARGRSDGFRAGESSRACLLNVAGNARARRARARRSRGRPGSSRAARGAFRARRPAPWSRTTISSASEIVERRCAMMSVVRPFIASRRPSRILRLRRRVHGCGRVVEDRGRADRGGWRGRSRSAGAGRRRA